MSAAGPTSGPLPPLEPGFPVDRGADLDRGLLLESARVQRRPAPGMRIGSHRGRGVAIFGIFTGAAISVWMSSSALGAPGRTRGRHADAQLVIPDMYPPSPPRCSASTAWARARRDRRSAPRRRDRRSSGVGACPSTCSPAHARVRVPRVRVTEPGRATIEPPRPGAAATSSARRDLHRRSQNPSASLAGGRPFGASGLLPFLGRVRSSASSRSRRSTTSRCPSR